MFVDEVEFLKLPAPKLGWDRDACKLVLSYYVGKDYGICQFKFDYHQFEWLYDRCKGYYKLTDEGGLDGRLSYVEFMKELGASERAAGVLGLVLKFYKLNPTVCKRIINQKNKGAGKKRKIELEPKQGLVDKAHGISKPRGKHGVGSERSYVNERFDIDFERMETLSFLMRSCVRKAAREFSMQPFVEYLSLYSEWLKVSGQGSGFIGKAKEKEVFKKFSSEVKSLQREWE